MSVGPRLIYGNSSEVVKLHSRFPVRTIYSPTTIEPLYTYDGPNYLWFRDDEYYGKFKGQYTTRAQLVDSSFNVENEWLFGWEPYPNVQHLVGFSDIDESYSPRLTIRWRYDPDSSAPRYPGAFTLTEMSAMTGPPPQEGRPMYCAVTIRVGAYPVSSGTVIQQELVAHPFTNPTTQYITETWTFPWYYTTQIVPAMFLVNGPYWKPDVTYPDTGAASGRFYFGLFRTSGHYSYLWTQTPCADIQIDTVYFSVKGTPVYEIWNGDSPRLRLNQRDDNRGTRPSPRLNNTTSRNSSISGQETIRISSSNKFDSGKGFF